MTALTLAHPTTTETPTRTAETPTTTHSARPPRRRPQLVESAPRTADVLRFHRPAPAPAPTPTKGSRTRTDGSSALAAEPLERRPRHLHAVPTPQQAEEIRKLAAAITRAAMEVLAGTRPATQLAPWLHRDLLAPVQLRADLRRAALSGAAAAGVAPGPKLGLIHRAAVVKAAHASLVEPGVYEAAVIVSDAARCRAVAMRFESAGRGWQVTALEIG